MTIPNYDDKLFYTLFNRNYVIKFANIMMIIDLNNGEIKKSDINDDLKEKYLIKSQDKLVIEENTNKSLIRILDVDFDTNYIIKTTYNTINQVHIPLIVFKDKSMFKKIMNMKKKYLVSKRTLKNIDDNIDFIKKTKDSNEFDYKTFSRRFKHLKERCKMNNYPEPNIDVFKGIYIEHLMDIKKDFKCFYCGQHLRFKGDAKIKKSVNYEDLYTFEHRIPLSKGGTHNKDNIVLSCLSCNVLKDDMDEETFIELIKSIPKELKYKLFQEKSKSSNRISSKFDDFNKTIKENNKTIIDLKKKNATLERTNKFLLDKT